MSQCPKTSTDIMREMQFALNSKKRNKPIMLDGDDNVDVDEVESEQPFATSTMASNASSNTIPSSGISSKRKKAAFQFQKPQQKAQTNNIESFLRKTPEEVVQERHSKHPSQMTIENRLRTPEDKERVHIHIANFFYECGIPFNVANVRSYEVMIESIGQYGPGLKPPTYHELRVPLLEKAKKQTDDLKAKHEDAWKQYGCTLMSDGWTDRRRRHLLNFLVNSPEGTYFMGSVDASSQSQDALMLANLLDSKTEEIGPEYIVQVVTDNAANYKAAGHILMQRRPTLFWTPCAAHCLDLMLEDIGKLKEFDPTIKNSRRITTFIYTHGRILNAMREKTNGKDIVRPGVTRFATSFLTLQSLYKHKDVLRQLFVSEDWRRCNLSATEAGNKVCDVVLSTTFWHQVEDCIRASQPLLIALRIVDGDERPALGEVFAAMECVKEKIKEAFDNKNRLYKKVMDIVERRWEIQMGQKLYRAALFLNPDKYFDIKQKNRNLSLSIREDFNDVLAKMVPEIDLVDKISILADSYDGSRESFGREIIIRQRKLKNPRE